MNDEGGQKGRTDRSRSKRNLTSAEYEIQQNTKCPLDSGNRCQEKEQSRTVKTKEIDET